MNTLQSKEYYIARQYLKTMRSFDALLPDSDGTLVDSVALIRRGQYETIVTYLRNKGLSDTELPDYQSYETILNNTIGGSAKDTLERTIKTTYNGNGGLLNDIDYDLLHKILNPIQGRISKDYIKPYQGFHALLKQLGQQGIKLAIFTSGTPHHIVRNIGLALPEIGIEDLFYNKSMSDKYKLDILTRTIEEKYSIPIFSVVTVEDTYKAKPDPEGIEIAMKRLAVKPKMCAVLGDHKVDMQAGMNASVPIRIGITHGFDDKQTLINAGATEIVDSLDKIKISL